MLAVYQVNFMQHINTSKIAFDTFVVNWSVPTWNNSATGVSVLIRQCKYSMPLAFSSSIFI